MNVICSSIFAIFFCEIELSNYKISREKNTNLCVVFGLLQIKYFAKKIYAFKNNKTRNSVTNNEISRNSVTNNEISCGNPRLKRVWNSVYSAQWFKSQNGQDKHHCVTFPTGIHIDLEISLWTPPPHSGLPTTREIKKKLFKRNFVFVFHWISVLEHEILQYNCPARYYLINLQNDL